LNKKWFFGDLRVPTRSLARFRQPVSHNQRHNNPLNNCYLVSPKLQEAIRNEVDKMLEAGIIEPLFISK